MNGPNPLQVAWSIVRATRRRRPAPQGTGTMDHTGFRPILDVLAQNGVAALCDVRPDLDTYRESLQTIDPDTLSRDEGLAFWLNLYNAAGPELPDPVSSRSLDLRGRSWETPPLDRPEVLS